jgi:hypothetical protein
MRIDTAKLVKAQTLIDELFEEGQRPCVRTIERWRARRIIPYYKIGAEVWFDLDKVRDALNRRALVKNV